MDLGGLIMTSEGGARRAPDPTQVSALGSATCDPWRDSLRVGASCVRLPLSSAHGTSSAEHQLQLARLPVRSPGQHMHPQLRHAAWAGPSDRAVRSA
jgi:hypothetical protein